MDYLYLLRLLYNNIDSVIISMITGIITSIFVTRIFFIKEDEDNKVNKLKEHSEVLYIVQGFFIALISSEENSNKSGRNYGFIKSEYFNSIKSYIISECESFAKMDFDNLDRLLKNAAIKNNDLVEDISNFILKKDAIPLKIVKYWEKEIEEIIILYNNRYKMKVHHNIVYKNIAKDKIVIGITIVIIACIIIG